MDSLAKTIVYVDEGLHPSVVKALNAIYGLCLEEVLATDKDLVSLMEVSHSEAWIDSDTTVVQFCNLMWDHYSHLGADISNEYAA